MDLLERDEFIRLLLSAGDEVLAEMHNVYAQLNLMDKLKLTRTEMERRGLTVSEFGSLV